VFELAESVMIVPVDLVILAIVPEDRAGAFGPAVGFAALGLEQAGQVANAPTLGNDPRVVQAFRCEERRIEHG
jgi:hypothetical protein